MMSNSVLAIVCSVLLGAALAVPVTETKVPDVLALEEPNYCLRPTGVFPHNEYCDMYYNCHENVAHPMDCPDGLVFDGRKRTCGFPKDIDCGLRKVRNPIVASAFCPRPDGYFRNEKDCGESFYVCTNGLATNLDCPPGLRFDNKKKTCHVDDSPCTV